MGRGRMLRPSGISSRQARIDSTAICLAKLIESLTGDQQPLHESMADLMGDPERHGAVTLALLNLVHQYSTWSGMKPEGFQELCDHLNQQLIKDKV